LECSHARICFDDVSRVFWNLGGLYVFALPITHERIIK
jgi:hypothetical protein